MVIEELVLDKLKQHSNQLNSKLTDVVIEKKDRNTDLLFVLLPEWAPYLAPYNIARLSSLINQAGYKSSCLDLNIEIYQESRKWLTELGYDPFNPNNLNKWEIVEYQKHLHKFVGPVLDKWINHIVNLNPKVIGFTLYFCNEGPVQYFVDKLKKRLPNTTFTAGGPNLHFRKDDIKRGTIYCDENKQPFFSYGIVGESEQIMIDILDSIDKGEKHEGMKIVSQPITQRINLNNFPLPNYEDFNFSKYEIPDGILTEFSRGCTAKCTFCSETHFWNYRQRSSVSALEEIDYLYHNKGVRLVWFLDSLVNGNLKELKDFAQGIIDRGIKIKWIGYARCDKRMDYEYLKLLRDSGCFSLKFGAESASNKVLEDMKKRVTNEEMEQNFKDCDELGIESITSWIQAFPTEEIEDFIHTLIFLSRNRTRIPNIAATPGYNLSAQTIVGQNLERFNLANFTYLDNWIKDDFSFAKPHTLTRAKLFDIFVREVTTANVNPRPLLNQMYSIKYNNPDRFTTLDYYDSKVEVFKFDSNMFKNRLVSEPFHFFYLLWKLKGGFEMTLKFDKDLDYQEYGYTIESPYWSDIYFKVDDKGKWETKVSSKFIQPPNPFNVLDYSHEKSQVIERARKFAKPIWGDGSRTKKEVALLHKQNQILNKTKDFSFVFDFDTKGNWDESSKSLF